MNPGYARRALHRSFSHGRPFWTTRERPKKGREFRAVLSRNPTKDRPNWTKWGIINMLATGNLKLLYINIVILATTVQNSVTDFFDMQISN